MSRKTVTSSHRIGLLALAAGVLAFANAAIAADPIKIGVTIAQSPPGSVSQGTQVKDGVEVAAKMINDAGGVLGRPIELVFEDTQGIPEKARAAVEKLITRDKVVAIVGEHQSSAVLAGMEVAHRYHVPYINTNGWSDAIREKGYPEVFNPGNYNSRVAIAMADTHEGARREARRRLRGEYRLRRRPRQAARRAAQGARGRASNTSTRRSTAPERTSCRRCCR